MKKMKPSSFIAVLGTIALIPIAIVLHSCTKCTSEKPVTSSPPSNTISSVESSTDTIVLDVIDEVDEIDEVKAYSPRELKCLTDNLYFEARGEGKKGMKLVGHVTMNRVESSRYPDTICSVVYQDGQFSWTRGKTQKPITEPTVYKKAEQIAKEIIHRKDKPLNGAMYFHTVSIKPKWSYYKTKVLRHKNHVFLK